MTQYTQSFRSFVQEKWYEHGEELLAWTGNLPEYDSTYYWQKNRWVLRAMYKAQCRTVSSEK